MKIYITIIVTNKRTSHWLPFCLSNRHVFFLLLLKTIFTIVSIQLLHIENFVIFCLSCHF